MRDILFRGKQLYNGEWVISRCPDGSMLAGTVIHDFIPETVEAEPIRHGHWIEYEPGIAAVIMTGDKLLYCCSECDAKYASKDNMRYCPHCGAKMDGDTP